jgi:glycerophosphoryl diester phosphodiesterase
MSELREFTINNSESNIISLDEMLHIVNASVPIIIEIKGNYSPYIENRIYEIIRSYTGKVAIKSFNIAYIQWICEFLPFLTKGLIVDRNNNNNLSILDMNLDFISCDIDFIDSNFMSKVRKKNIPIITWTVDSLEKKQKAKMYSDNIIFEKIVP